MRTCKRIVWALTFQEKCLRKQDEWEVFPQKKKKENRTEIKWNNGNKENRYLYIATYS